MHNDDNVVVDVRGLGKRYLVPQRHEHEVGKQPTVREQLKEFFPSILGADESDYFWALKDVSFQVKRGEVFGIVGQNGSGKSTLLKILSRVTHPTEGEATIRGRVGSLLEVGTGFHPDLTGRQNIYFNGGLLGVSQQGIREKIDEIIAFSGIGQFIDVPVKRYSSGMYIRLAYSVASLLESDVLVLDEVMAVGDAAFRTKTETHIRDATSSGKTVLLVSHSAQTIVSTCDRGIVLDRGRMVFSGTSKEVISEYMSGHYALGGDTEREDGSDPRRSRMAPRSHVKLAGLPRLRPAGSAEPRMVIQWLSVHNLEGDEQATFNTGDGVRFRIGYSGVATPELGYFSILIHNTLLSRMVTAHSTHSGEPLRPGESGVVECVIPSLMLGDGLYNVMVDHGIYDFAAKVFQSQDCVSHATHIQVSTNGQFKGVGVDEFQGAPHLSAWMVLGQEP